MVSGAPAPKADPEAFFPLGAIALPAITGNALIDGLLIGKIALLKGNSVDSSYTPTLHYLYSGLIFPHFSRHPRQPSPGKL